MISRLKFSRRNRSFIGGIRRFCSGHLGFIKKTQLTRMAFAAPPEQSHALYADLFVDGLNLFLVLFFQAFLKLYAFTQLDRRRSIFLPAEPGKDGQYPGAR